MYVKGHKKDKKLTMNSLIFFQTDDMAMVAQMFSQDEDWESMVWTLPKRVIAMLEQDLYAAHMVYLKQLQHFLSIS